MPTRKQREIIERHELILDKARKLFIDQGYHSVTMDSIAKEMEYSKGTIYQHFSSKECIILTLRSRVCTLMLELFTSIANEKHLNPRMQIILIFESFMLFQELRQDDVQLKILADSQPFSVKVPDDIANESKQIEQQTFEVVVSVVNRAIENKQIILKEGSNAENIALGGWGLAQGIYMLAQKSGCATTFTIDPPKELLRVNSILFLDGVGWETYSLTAKRKQLISDYSVQFKEVINGYYSSF